MQILGVKLHFPSNADLQLLPLCLIAGFSMGAALVKATHGPTDVALAMGACGVAAGFLCAAGANLDAGWRGAALCLAGAGASYVCTLSLLAG